MKSYICEVDYAITTDKVVVWPWVVNHDDQYSEKIGPFTIQHPLLEEWARESGRLAWEINKPHPVTGEHDPEEGEHSYGDWLQSVMSSEDLVDYLRENAGLQLEYINE